MSKAYVFPGQGAQFSGMGKELYESHSVAKEHIDSANDILGFDIKSIMFEGSADELKQTKVTQPAVFIHSVVAAITSENFKSAEKSLKPIIAEIQSSIEKKKGSFNFTREESKKTREG